MEIGLEWQRANDGYVYIHDGTPPGTELHKANYIYAKGAAVTDISPLVANPLLFLEFAYLHEDRPETCVAFADKYGLLTLSPPNEPNTRRRRPPAAYDYFAHWKREIVRMRQAVELRRKNKLHQLLNPPSRIAKRVTFGGLVQSIGRSRGAPLADNEVEKLLRQYRQAPPNRKSATLRTIAEQHLPASMVTEEFEAESNPANHIANIDAIWTLGSDLTLRYQFRPRNLLDGMWLQFASKVTGDQPIRECEQCFTWFETGPGAARRSDSRFCSDRCRSQYNNERRRQAAFKGDTK